jgi:hypothetical protein
VRAVSTSGLSRRALFGLGLSRLGDRLDDRRAPARPGRTAAPTLEDLHRRWAAQRIAGGAALWTPVAEALRSRAGDLGGARVLVHGLQPPGDPPFDAALSVFGVQSTPDGRGALRELFRSVAPGGVVAFAVWTAGPVPRLLRAAAQVDPLPAALPGAWRWGNRERLRQELDHVADDIAYARDELVLDFAGPDEALATLAPAVPAVGAALAAGGETARRRLEAELGDGARGGPVRVAVPFLVVVARSR